MKMPLSAGNPLHAKDWEAVRKHLIFECCKWDIQSEDHSVVADFPLFLEEEEWRRIASLAEKLAQEVLLAERELLSKPDLHSKLGLPKKIRKVLQKCSPEDIPASAARVMRFDFHPTSVGWRISEVNADVPGGFIEASGFTRLMADHYSGYCAPTDPSSEYSEAISSAASAASAIGLVHATAHCDDRQVMEYLARKLQREGKPVVLVAPNHLKWESGFAKVMSSFARVTPDLLIRFFPAEWLPNLRPEAVWEPWFRGSKTLMSNPGSALLTQSKRFPIVCEELKTSLATWRSLLPETKCPTEVDTESPDWVFKPVFGRVGEDIAMAEVTKSQAYKEIVKLVNHHPENWAAQRRFESLPIETHCGRRYPCIGVFTVDARAVGIYARIAAKPLIDHEAQDIAVLIHRKE